MKVEDKLALNKFEIDKEVHIQVEEKLCQDCDLKPCPSISFVPSTRRTFTYPSPRTAPMLLMRSLSVRK